MDERIKDYFSRQELTIKEQKIQDLKNRIQSQLEILTILRDVDYRTGGEFPSTSFLGMELAFYELCDELKALEASHEV